MINNLRFLGRILPLGIFVFINLTANAQQLAFVDKGMQSKPSYTQSSSEVYLMDVISALAYKYKVKINYDTEIIAGKKLPANAIKKGESTLESELEQILKPFNLKFEKFGKDSYAIYPQANTQKEVKSLEKSGLDDRIPAESNDLKNLNSRSSELALEKRDITITGTVTSDTGEPLPGVNVVLKGTTIGASTDFNGKYSLKLKSADGILVFSFLGYVTEEVAIGGQTTIDLAMLPDIKTLGEIVVVGYGTQKKTDLTGSVVTVSSKDFNQGQVITPEQLITGKVAGVQITSNGGAPGSGSQIRIRGGSSLNANNDPLIVIDGVPLDNNAISGSANPLSTINPNDIESFSILKDASATAIYGSRASNGVIIITTKKGKAGDKFSIGASSIASISQITKTVDMLSADEFRKVVSDYGAKYGSADVVAKVGAENTNWQDLIFRTALTHDSNLNFSGALKSVPFRLSAGYMDQQGILLTSAMKRSSASLNLNPTLFDEHLKLNLNLKGMMTSNHFADESAIGNAAFFDPTQSPYSNEAKYGGYFEWLQISGGNPIALAPKNPLSALQQVDNTSSVKRSIGNAQLDYRFHFLPELRANLNVGYDISSSEGNTISPATLASVFIQKGTKNHYSQTKSNNLLDFYLNYTKDLEGIASRIDITGGYSYQSFITDAPGYPTLANNEKDTIFRGPNSRSQNVLISFFGRLNYTLKDRYLVTATLRRDGSSRFSPDNRWGTFPSIALGWRINKESFMENSKLFSDLKLRAGAGITGQQDIGSYYPYLARYISSNNEASYQLGDTFYKTLRAQGYDFNIKWEQTKTYNIGLDYGFADGRISGTVDYYIKDTKDMLAEIPLPAGSNLTNRLVTNVGSMENKGLEAAININIIKTDKARWDFGFNATFNKNKITKLSKTSEDPIGSPTGGIGGGVGNTIQVQTVGYSAYSFYVYKQVYNEKGDPIEGLYADLNKDGVIDSQDKYRYKSPAPQAFLGFNSTFSYGGFSMGFVMRASIGNYVYNNQKANAYYSSAFQSGWLINIPKTVLETNFVGGDPNRQYSDLFVENASFLRMDNINMGYNFGKLLSDKTTLRLSATCQNAFLITKFSGIDPEIASGINNTFYPRPRIYSLGLNIGF